MPSAMGRHAQVFKLFFISPLCRRQLAPLRILSSSPHGIYSLLSDSPRCSCEHQKWLRAFSCGQNVRQLGLNHRSELESCKDLRDGMQEGDARTASLNEGGLRPPSSTASEDPKLDREVAEEISLTDNCVRVFGFCSYRVGFSTSSCYRGYGKLSLKMGQRERTKCYG
uniref:Uncharacterized protein n=1 Tax=Physcomitrium patens TaxID=3218 RepID=A0A7I4ADV6_PHYPA